MNTNNLETPKLGNIKDTELSLSCIIRTGGEAFKCDGITFYKGGEHWDRIEISFEYLDDSDNVVSDLADLIIEIPVNKQGGVLYSPTEYPFENKYKFTKIRFISKISPSEKEDEPLEFGFHLSINLITVNPIKNN